jgi:hypothetical protein
MNRQREHSLLPVLILLAFVVAGVAGSFGTLATVHPTSTGAPLAAVVAFLAFVLGQHVAGQHADSDARQRRLRRERRARDWHYAWDTGVTA